MSTRQQSGELLKPLRETLWRDQGTLSNRAGSRSRDDAGRGARTERATRRVRIPLGLKLLVSLSLVSFIVYQVDWAAVSSAISQTDMVIVSVVFVCMLLNVGSSSLKWKILLSIHGIHYDFVSLYRYYLSATFFNNFLPTSIGGDGYRLYRTMKNPTSRAGAVSALLVERITGLTALIFVGSVGAFVGSLKSGEAVPWISLLFGGLALAVVAVLLWTVSRSSRVGYLLKWKPIAGISEKLLVLVNDFRRLPKKLVQVGVISIGFYLFLLTYRLLLIYAAGSSISWFNLAVAVSVSTVVALIPISINGLGLMDGSFLYLLVHYGVATEHAVIVTLLIRVLQVLISLVGGVIYVVEKRSAKA